MPDQPRICCDTNHDELHAPDCPVVFGPHRLSHTVGRTAHCRCGTTFTDATDIRDARAAHAHHARENARCTNPAHLTTRLTADDHPRCEDCGRIVDDPLRAETPPARVGPAAAPPVDIYDATSPPGVTQLPAVTTSMTPEQFKGWLNSDGTLFMVILPANRTFVIKVPAAQHEFFVAMMQQVRFALGPEVQAVRMNMVTGDPAAADGTASEAPDWAQPQTPGDPA